MIQTPDMRERLTLVEAKLTELQQQVRMILNAMDVQE